MNTTAADAWDVDEEGFPRAAGTAEQLRFLVRYATLAPSGHNTQPWRFRVTEGDGVTAVEVYADRSRRLPVADPEDRELTIACGAAVYFLRLAMRRFGMRPETSLLPGQNADLMAVLSVGGTEEPTEDDLRLFGAIPYRRTSREGFEGLPVPEELLGQMEQDAADEGAWLQRVDDLTERESVVALIGEGDRRLFADPAFRLELSRWVHPDSGPAGDGIPGGALGMPGLASHLSPFLMRYGMPAAAVVGADERTARTSPALVVLGTAGDGPADRLRAGQALGRALLRATADGVQASFLNQPIQAAELRPRLRDVIGARGFPQLLMRLGYEYEGRHPDHAPRRPTSDVLL